MAFWKSKEERERERRENEEEETLQNEHQAKLLIKEAERNAVVEALISFCLKSSLPLVQALRTQYAASGRAFTERGEDVLFADVYGLVLNFSRANGRISQELGGILLDFGSANSASADILRRNSPISQGMYDLNQSLIGKDKWNFWWNYSKEASALLQEEVEVTLPISVGSLAALDQKNGTSHAQECANIFLNLATVVCAQGDSDFEESNAFVKNAYIGVLSPFLDIPNPDSRRTRFKETAQSSHDGDTEERTVCTDCVTSYSALGLSDDASPDDVKAAYRDFAKMYHPDRFPEGEQRLRLRAEQEFKKVKQAYSHIIEHPSE